MNDEPENSTKMSQTDDVRVSETDEMARALDTLFKSASRAAIDCNTGLMDDALAQAEAIINKYPKQPEDWRLIETAPKDGSLILGGCWHGARWAIDITKWEHDGWWQMRQIPPTHWVTLKYPSPPRNL